jgi:hypothetical protein
LSLAARPRTIRVRQRSRTSLRAFADPLAPLFGETGIDRLQVSLRGSCQCTGRGFTADDYRSLLATSDPDIDWMGTPQASRDRVKLQTRASVSATIGFSILARDIAANRVDLSFVFQCNPTQTLAHLLSRFGGGGDVASVIRSLDEVDFFSSATGAPLSLDNKTNWIANPDLAYEVFGPDVFSEFLPIYVNQLRAFAMRLASPEHWSALQEDGGQDVHRSDVCEIRLDWPNAKAPQCETYFERYHGSATAVVRSAAQNVLTKLDHATVRHHLYETGFERRGGLFSMRCRLANDRELSIYAKVPDRLRFEISRKKAGRYHVPVQPGPSGRLLAILASERELLLTGCQWRMVGDLLTEHGVPLITDLTALISWVASTCAGGENDFHSVITALLIDGGISLTAENGALIAALQGNGIIERTTLRSRDHPMPRRYALTDRYLAVFENILDVCSSSDPPAPL